MGVFHLMLVPCSMFQVIGGAFYQAHPDGDRGSVQADGGGHKILPRGDVDARL